jgi:hypothetical protein
VVTLFKYTSPKDQVSENGKITADKLQGPMAGKKISDLTTAMTNGGTYVNIHTEKNSNGEIRGQISSSSGSMTGGNSTAQQNAIRKGLPNSSDSSFLKNVSFKLRREI